MRYSRIANSAMILKPQDIVILLKIVALSEGQWSYASLATELAMSTSEVHAGIKRAVAARLMDAQRGRPLIKSLEEFLIHGVKSSFPPEAMWTFIKPPGIALVSLYDHCGRKAGTLLSYRRRPPVYPAPFRCRARRPARGHGVTGLDIRAGHLVPGYIPFT